MTTCRHTVLDQLHLLSEHLGHDPVVLVSPRQGHHQGNDGYDEQGFHVVYRLQRILSRRTWTNLFWYNVASFSITQPKGVAKSNAIALFMEAGSKFSTQIFLLKLKQGYLVERLKSSFRKFYGRYGDLVEQYEVTLSRMLNDILTLDQQWLPYQSDFPPISWPLYRAWPSPNYEWFPWSICNGCG